MLSGCGSQQTQNGETDCLTDSACWKALEKEQTQTKKNGFKLCNIFPPQRSSCPVLMPNSTTAPEVKSTK